MKNTVKHLRQTKHLQNSKAQCLVHLCHTRWVERLHSLLVLVELMPVVVECRQDMQNDGNAVISTKAVSFVNCLQSAVTKGVHPYCVTMFCIRPVFMPVVSSL